MSLPHTEFHDKVVLITGASSGLGATLARTLAAKRARLVLGDINETRLLQFAGQLRAEGAQVHAQGCDVSSEAEVKALCSAAASTFGTLDIAVNNAGMSPPRKKLVDTTEQDMDMAFAVNAKGVLFGMKHQIPLMERAGGAILNVSSVAGIGASPKLAAYSAAKHAIIGLSKTAAVEYARERIRVNAICPFYTATPLVTQTEMAMMQDFYAQSTPMKRIAQPEEVVAAMLSLIAPGNTYLTGQVLAVDGGVTAY